MKTKTTVTLLTGIFLFFSGVVFAQSSAKIPIHTIATGKQFDSVVHRIKTEEAALYVFDIDNTLLITNDNWFGSDWWFEQTGKNPGLKLHVTDSCLFNVLTPLFYSIFDTKTVFAGQAAAVNSLKNKTHRTIALTSRGYTPVIATATELELTKNQFQFLEKDSAMMSNNVVLLNGVIYTAGKNKGTALMNYVQNHPQYTKIYYFDDSENKVVDVQQAFSGSGFNISLYHLMIAAKIPFTEKEIEYMKSKLCNLIQSINNVGETTCKCNNQTK